jgi:hypothetical protein
MTRVAIAAMMTWEAGACLLPVTRTKNVAQHEPTDLSAARDAAATGMRWTEKEIRILRLAPISRRIPFKIAARATIHL